MIRSRTIGVLIGAAFLILAAWLYVRAVIREHTHDSQPLILPVSLAPGTIKTTEIKANLNYDYDIVLDLEGLIIQGQKIIPSSGLRPDTHSASSGAQWVPNLIDISWELFEGGNLVSAGNSVTNEWTSYSDALEGTIGKFKGREGGRYSLVLHVNKDASMLNVDNPTIKVQIPRGLWEDYGVGISIQKGGAGILAIIGAAILGATFFNRRRRTPRPFVDR